jgi:hypothetical protein
MGIIKSQSVEPSEEKSSILLTDYIYNKSPTAPAATAIKDPQPLMSEAPPVYCAGAE